MASADNSPPLGPADVQAAAGRIGPHARRTPVLTSGTLDALAGVHLFFKCENLQRVGAFKFRGAANAVFSLPDSEAARGVVTHSSGNHGAALALAAHLRGVPAHVVVPHGAAMAKVAAIARHGAHLVRCAPTLAAREAATADVIAATGATLVHPYNDLRVMAGQGTVALEFLTQVAELDALVAPVSGGGLISGCAVTAAALRPGLRVIGVEPAGADDAARSLRARTIVREPEPRTICDGLRACLGPLTFAVMQQHVHAVVAVSDDETIRAMRLLWDVLKLVVEPSSAVTLAAVLAGRVTSRSGERIGLVLTGGNVDLDRLPWSAASSPAR